MISHLRVIFFVCFFIQALIAFPQTALIKPEQLQSIIPPSPNAASLGKYGEHPVGTYNGLPDISVPLYVINSGKIQVPVTLSYHSAGIKVEEVASSVGLGWSLSVPGAIVRQTRGLPDEHIFGYQNTHEQVYKYINNQMTEAEKNVFFTAIKVDNIDTEPDLFTYNINGQSGSFYYDLTGNIVTIPRTTLKISYSGNGWEILDNQGFVYQFQISESTHSLPNGQLAPATTYDPYTSTTAWYATKITNLNALDDEINFEYEYYTNYYYTLSSQTKYVLNTGNQSCPGKDPTNSYSYNTVSSVRLKKIVFKDGSIDFNKANTARLDLPYDYALDNISIKNSDESFFKKFFFKFHYIGSPYTPSPWGSEYSQRLMLDEVEIKDGTTNTAGKYLFEYNTQALPQRLSYNQDFWGYYNTDVNTQFVPTTILYPIGGGSPTTVLGANRKVNPTYSKAGMLTEIIYPTGGYTTFVFENNMILSSDPPQMENSQGNVQVGTVINGGGIYTSPVFTLVDCTPGDGNPYVSCQSFVFNSGCGNGNANLECPRVDIYNVTTGYYAPLNHSGPVSLPAGQYYLQLDVQFVPDPEIANSAYAWLTYPQCDPIIIGGTTYYNVLSGGHRIKEINTYDQSDRLASSKSYSYIDPENGYSSGRLVNSPKYISNITEILQTQLPWGGTVTFNCDYISISSGSNYPLVNTKSSTTGYKYVKELIGQVPGQGGITEYYYKSPESNPDIYNQSFPFPPATNFDWQRGHLIREVKSKSIDVNGSLTFQKVQEKIVEYSEKGYVGIMGLKTGERIIPGPGVTLPFTIETAAYDVKSGWYMPISETIHSYDETNVDLKNTWVSDIFYNNINLQANNTTGTANRGFIINKITYPKDYTTVNNVSHPENNGLIFLIGRNMLNVPIEQISIRKNTSGQEFVAAGKLITYKPDKPYPDKVFNLELNAPLLLSSFVPSSVNAIGEFIKDSRYKEVISYDEYDNYGNPIQLRKTGDIKNSIIWDYKNQYPIAEVKNADKNSIAYTSFEADGTGNWSQIISGNIDQTSPTISGLKSYSLTSAGLKKDGLNSSLYYIVSYWSMNGSYTIAGTNGQIKQGRAININGNNWNYFEHSVTGQTTITIAGSGKIDELRLYPKGALMTSYTYKPLIGIIGQCDVNNNITYYEYDKFGRLQLIRDQEKNILKTFEYKFQETQQ